MVPNLDAILLLPALFSLLTTSRLATISASAALVNVTIDDTYGDPINGAQVTYEPLDAWNVGQSCTACTAHPDPTLAHNGTWHDGTVQAGSTQLLTAMTRFEGALQSFSGVAVYVYCIVTRSSVSPDGNSDMTFFIDGEPVGAFVQPPDGDTAYDYNVPVYTNMSLAAGAHEIVILAGQPNGNKSLILLDYIVYTFVIQDAEQPLNTSDMSTSASIIPSTIGSIISPRSSAPLEAGSSSPNTAQKRTIVIAVATVCGVLGLAAAIIVISYCCLRGRHSKYNAPAEDGVIPRSPSHIEVNPATSGWAEGTWAPGAEEPPHPSLSASPSAPRAGLPALGSGRRKPSGKRRRDAPDTNAANSSEELNKMPQARPPIIPPTLLHSIPAFGFSPSSASNARADAPGSPASSSWGTPAHMAPDSATYLIPPSRSSSTSHIDVDRAYAEAGGSTQTLSSHHAHPFAKAQGVNPTPLVRSRSDTSRSIPAGPSQPPPSSMPSAFVPRRRGDSGSRVPLMAGDLSLSSGTTSPTTPASVPYTTQTIDTDESFLPSPSPADPSPLSFASIRLPERQQQYLRPSPSQQQRRRVDPVDPALQPPRDRDARAPRPLPSQSSHKQTQSESRARPTGSSQRERRRYGFVDVPIDAGSSRPPSYREGG
ncbi:hypothetical protein C8Q73DRAFT_651697 [Cubamyces lactineus]|nr:hypothetical protein C8Q73DRAFT_651697 [Cubamyces lactineus]